MEKQNRNNNNDNNNNNSIKKMKIGKVVSFAVPATAAAAATTTTTTTAQDSISTTTTNNNTSTTTYQDGEVLELTNEICRQLWYQKDELSSMKRDVKFLLSQPEAWSQSMGWLDESDGNGNDHHNHQQNHQHNHRNDDDKNHHETMTGLGRFSQERAQHKRSALYYILASQYAGRTGDRLHHHDDDDDDNIHRRKREDYIYAVSRRCTGWARNVATQEAFALYCEVYGDPIDNLLNTSSWEEDLQSFNDSFLGGGHGHGGKQQQQQQQTTQEEEQSSKRQRMNYHNHRHHSHLQDHKPSIGGAPALVC